MADKKSTPSSPGMETETWASPVAGKTSKATPGLQLKADQLEPNAPLHVPGVDTHAPATPGRETTTTRSDYKVDIQKAPGRISYAEAAKEHKDAAGQKARESAGAAKESAADAGQAARESAHAARAKAGQAAEAAKESVSETAEATKSKASEATSAAKETAGAAKEKAAETAQATKEKAGELADSAREQAAHMREVAGQYAEAARERGAEVVDAAKEYAQAAAEKTQEAASAAGETVRSVVETVKEHLPRVERAESTPAERESKALLDEALALAGGTAPPTYIEHRPELYAPPATTTTTPTPSTPTPTPTTTSTSATPVSHLGERAAAEGPYEAARGMVPDTLALDPVRSPPAEHPAGAPDELVARAQRAEQEEVSAQGPLQALTDKVKEAAEYVREHVALPGKNYGSEKHPEWGAQPHLPHPSPGTPPASPGVHEYRALPGDIHIPLLARAVREHVMPGGHEEPAASARDAADAAKRAGSRLAEEARSTADTAEAKAGGAYQTAKDKAGGVAQAAKEGLLHHEDTTRGTGLIHHDPDEDRVGAKASQTYESAADKASGAYDAVAGKASETYQSAADTAKGVYQTAADKASGAYQAAADTVHQVEDKAKWTVEHTKGKRGRLRALVPFLIAANFGYWGAHRILVTGRYAVERSKFEKLHESAEQWRESVTPHTVEEAKLAQGEVPSNTEEILKARGAA
ncbi:hypothetical protein N2152v2_008449 [Parachlorella kessleri]